MQLLNMLENLSLQSPPDGPVSGSGAPSTIVVSGAAPPQGSRPHNNETMDVLESRVHGVEQDAKSTSRRTLGRPGRSLVKLGCPWCDKTGRRPSELKEHMYAHYGLAMFPCPRPGCTHVSNRQSNCKRHMFYCQAGRVSDGASLSEAQVSQS
ncbi:hypothetical protein FRC08_003554 [Ceratobasidium sp. 394]|nr:hypothetical protein FRC08_003554 [Ceratobasidium sp. 394]